MGVIQFLEEDYKQVHDPVMQTLARSNMKKAETYLTEAWELCHRSATRNKE